MEENYENFIKVIIAEYQEISTKENFEIIMRKYYEKVNVISPLGGCYVFTASDVLNFEQYFNEENRVLTITNTLRQKT